MYNPTLYDVDTVKEVVAEVVGEDNFSMDFPADRVVINYLHGWSVTGTINCILQDYFGIR